MALKINFTDVEGQRKFSPLPGGKYLMEVTDFTEGEASEQAKNPGAPTISWELTVADDAQNPEDAVGRKVWENQTIVQSSLWRLKAFLQACGFAADEEVDFEPDEVLGSTFVAELGIQKARKNRQTGEEYPARNVVRSFHSVVSGDQDV
jgi:hypothetical protein